ncbi:MAG: hypothetical protein KF723_14325 [Rhizobiaceae bacterium]|nr:hypothetical protein [Rhizobiaceae bacterium]
MIQPLGRRAARVVITELGPDPDAVRAQDRHAIRVDLGLSLPQCDFCIRTADPELLAILRTGIGLPLFEATDALHAIFAAHPHRVVVTNIGRIEVFQKIGGPETGGVSPEGPHTHLLPKLLKSCRTHSANTPIPEGLLPLGSFHPASPVMTPLGKDREFDPDLHDEFQSLLAQYGVAEIVDAKEANPRRDGRRSGPGGLSNPEKPPYPVSRETRSPATGSPS